MGAREARLAERIEVGAPRLAGRLTPVLPGAAETYGRDTRNVEGLQGWHLLRRPNDTPQRRSLVNGPARVARERIAGGKD